MFLIEMTEEADCLGRRRNASNLHFRGVVWEGGEKNYLT